MWKTYRTEPRNGSIVNHQVRRFRTWGCLVRIVDVKSGGVLCRPFFVADPEKCAKLIAAAREWAR